MKLKSLNFLIILIISLFTLGCNSDKEVADISATARIRIPTYNVVAPKAGKLLGIIAEKGERIRKGQPLFAIEDLDADTEVNVANSNLARLEAELDNIQSGNIDRSISAASSSVAGAEENFKAAQQTYDKMLNLYNIGGLPKNKLDTFVAQRNAAQGNLEATRSHLANLQRKKTPEAIKELEANIANAKTTAEGAQAIQESNEGICPTTGIITEIASKTGDVVAKGDTVIIIQSLNDLTAQINLTPTLKEAARIGAPVTITAKSLNKPFTGTIKDLDNKTITIFSDTKPEELLNNSEIIVKFNAK